MFDVRSPTGGALKARAADRPSLRPFVGRLAAGSFPEHDVLMRVDDVRDRTLARYCAEMLAVEHDVAATLGQHARVLPEAERAVLQGFQQMVGVHEQALEDYLDGLGGRGRASFSSGASSHLIRQSAGSASSTVDVLRADHTAFTHAAIGYASLFEVALKLHEPPLRELAPRHLHGHAQAAQQTGRLIIEAVGRELAATGLHCQCICPMCSLGVCGCVAVATSSLSQGWSGAATAADDEAGFTLPQPRPGSQLALAGVAAGDHLLRIDDQPVLDVSEIQAAIRKHRIGDHVRLTLTHGARQPPYELGATHVSDYPPD